MPELNATQWISIIGWPVTFILGIAATLITQKIIQTKKRISWTVASESDLFSRDVLDGLADEFRAPIKILVDDVPQVALSIIRVKLANTGNIEIEDLVLHFKFGSGSNLHVGRYIGDLGVYQEVLQLEKGFETASLAIKHINRRQVVEVEFLVSGYSTGEFRVDLAAPGVELRKTDLATIEATANFTKSISMGFMGLKYDPVATHTAALVDEIKKLRQIAEETQRRNDG